MPKTISLTEVNPNEIKIESQPKTIALSGINPEEIKIESELRPRREIPALEAGLQGAAQGASFGFSDEIIGGLQAAIASQRGGNLKENYKKFRDENRAQLDAAQMDQPGAYLAGNVAGGFATAPLFGPLAGAKTAANVGRAALGGAVTGAGLSRPESMGELTEDVLGGAALGGVTQFGLSKVGNAFGKLKPQALKKFAEERAVKAAGAMTKEMRDLGKTGQLQQTGRDLLDKKIVTAFASLDDIVERTGALKKEAGKKIGDILGYADDLFQSTVKMIDEGQILQDLPPAGKAQAKKLLTENVQFSMKRVGERIKTELVRPNDFNPVLKGEMGKLTSLADDFLERGAVSLKAGNVLKTSQGKATNFTSDTVPQAYKKEVYSIIRDELDTAVSKIATLEESLSKAGVGIGALSGVDPSAGIVATAKNAANIPRPGFDPKAIAETYAAAKSDYGVGKRVGDIASKRLGATRSNELIGLKDLAAATAGAAAGGGPGGVALGAASKFMRKYGATLQATGADKLAQILEKSPTALGKFGAQIEAAYTKSPIALLVTHRALMKDPDYRNLLENFETEERQVGLPIPKRGSGLTLPGR